MKEVSTQGSHAFGATLSKLDEVVDEYVSVADGALVAFVGDGCLFLRKEGAFNVAAQGSVGVRVF